MSGSSWVFYSHFLFFFFFSLTIICSLNQPSFAHGLKGNETLVPLMEPLSSASGNGMMDLVVMNATRRKLGRFQICALCTCCGGPKGLCLPSPCCYAINCNIPNRPFGFCSFTPKTCNCFGCHL